MTRQNRILGLTITPLTRRRLANFRANRRGYWSLWLFLGLFVASLFAELIANDRPILIGFEDTLYYPVFIDYPETTFGGFLETTTEYADPEVREMIEEKGWIIWPLVRFSYDTVNYELKVPAPAPPSELNWLGTDDQGRDVAARLISALLVTGIAATFISILIMIWAQQILNPSQIAIIFALEPVFAAFFAIVFAGEVLGFLGYMGGGLIVLAVAYGSRGEALK